MSSICKRAWAEVNLDHIAHNIRQIRDITSKDAKIMAIVKADAYGHGSLQICKTLLDNGADCLGVALIDEAKQLRKQGVKAQILILGHTPLQRAAELIDLDITQTIFNYSLAKALSEAAIAKNKRAKIHIKIDTGMTRLGFDCDENGINTILSIAKLPGIEIEGIFTHFSSADELDTDFTHQQFRKFMDMCGNLKACGLDIPVKHVCNSAGIINYPNMHLDMVRPGIILYGLYPSEELDKGKVCLRPAMELKAVIVQLKEISGGIPVSYGRKFTARKKTVVATIPIGYADGFSRILDGKAKMIAGDQIVPVIGNVCMDYCMIDVTNVKDIKVGDEVVIFGGKSELYLPVENISKAMGTINYETVCSIGKRLPRIYMKNNETVEILNYWI